ncbi:TetR family transcriptional regulator [Arthrobacter sp. zg-Y238]|uniref:TetR family transcriptional regulator n=1 Tax=Arthrobacter sp. zg-Y238 TaxID=2964614 RepID=UPI002103A56B|nr:TetR family transcriptional regulator [Arthrobacter sp. zg-Y238]MCQ1951900.1 TetR/AcrR family transcriptional regulator [Arthrobacter sp. zg-Y238]
MVSGVAAAAGRRPLPYGGPPVNLREQQRSETRQRFIDTAMQLFQEQGFTATSMNQIAVAAGGSRANLYLHFRNKPELVMAKMRDIEQEITDGYRALDELPQHDFAALRGWLVDTKGLWSRYAIEFAAMEQAMAADTAVADEWLGMLRRVSGSMERLYRSCSSKQEREELQTHLVTFMMSLDRNFYFLYVRGHQERHEMVLDALTRQLMSLFADRFPSQ